MSLSFPSCFTQSHNWYFQSLDFPLYDFHLSALHTAYVLRTNLHLLFAAEIESLHLCDIIIIIMWHHIIMWHRGPKPFTCRFLLFLLNHILHCICFKILFWEWKCLVSNWSYTRLMRTIKKWKNRIKSLRCLCHRNPMQSSLHYSETYSGQ